MRDHGQWSVSLGRWGGVQVRLHIFLVLFAAFTLYLSWQAAQLPKQADSVPIALLSLVVLTLSVFAHEWGHVWAMKRLGGTVDSIVIWPLGGLHTPERPREPQADLIVQLAGPLTNLSIAAVCLPLLLFENAAGVPGLLNPLGPQGLIDDSSTFMVVWKLIFWVNWVLAIVNFFPAFPFDGSRILRSALAYRYGEQIRPRITLLVSFAAQIGAVMLLVVAWFARDAQPQEAMVPMWFALVVLAILLFFSAHQERHKPAANVDSEDQPFGYDFSQGYTSLERSYDAAHDESGPISRWLEERREARQKRQQEIELEEDRRMDELLARISVHGIQSLSPEEKSLLDRVSARYRQRHGN